MPTVRTPPTSDGTEPHEYPVTKSRKTASTGGGRAWSEEEETYLRQTRSQKTPYKSIAAYLKKTELACRLHYHQLCHGNNRRRRTTSVSSASSPGHSPILPASTPSPAYQCGSLTSSPGVGAGLGVVLPTFSSTSPPTAHIQHHQPQHEYYLHQSHPLATIPRQPEPVQLPSIQDATGTRLPAILPSPLASSGLRPHLCHILAPFPESHGTLLPPADFSRVYRPTSTPALQLDCSCSPSIYANHYQTSHPQQRNFPPPPSPVSSEMAPVDMARLQAIYATHRSAFWGTVASEYGQGASPFALEHAWLLQRYSPPHASMQPTPNASPERGQHYHPFAFDRTRISALLHPTMNRETV